MMLLLGLLIGTLSAPVCVAIYKHTLRLCAKQRSTEKLGDGFYYIVPESEYVKMRFISQSSEDALDEAIGKIPAPEHVATAADGDGAGSSVVKESLTTQGGV